MFFLAIILGLLLFDAAFWWWADRRLRPMPRAKAWRIAMAIFMGLQLGGYVFILATRMADVRLPVPLVLLSLLYVWHLLILPPTIVLLCLLLAGQGVRRVVAGRRPVPDGHGPTRRQLLMGAAAAVPPLVATGWTGSALAMVDDFRIRPLDIPVAGLPPALEGLVIAHVSDSHVGRFTNGPTLRAIADAVNGLDADLVLFTGDLIDFDLEDLPAGIDMLRRMKSRYGLFAVEGNHDLFQSRSGFEQGMRQAGIPLLLDEARTLYIRNHPVQVLGLGWGDVHDRRQVALSQRFAGIRPLIDPHAFPILLAHHPHAFDHAAEAGLPLVLAGHTHGGQLMLTKTIGAGAVLFKYLSGLYRQGRSSLVVTNGVGNWFPVRINAPAEIIRLRLLADR